MMRFSLFLLLNLSILTSIVGKECGTATRGKQIKEMTKTSHVLVALLEDDNKKDDDSVWKGICERFSQTIDSRVTDFTMVSVVDPSTQKKLWEQSRPAPNTGYQRILYQMETFLPNVIKKKLTESNLLRPTKTKPSLPSYILFQQGTSYESASGLRYPKGENEEEETTVTVDNLTTFVSQWLNQKKIGNFVYSLGVYDMLAAQTMSLIETYGHEHWKSKLWVYGIFRMCKYVLPTNMEFERELKEMYEKSAKKILEGGGSRVVIVQIERIERMLDEKNNKKTVISPLQREQLSQRLYIWKRFSEPITLSSDDMKQFLFRMVMNIVSVVGIAILIPFLFLTTGTTEEEEEEEADATAEDGDEKKEEEVVKEEKQEDEAEDSDTRDLGVVVKEESVEDEDLKEEEEEETPTPKKQALSKKEQLAIAQAKAKAMMADDKAKVKSVLERKKKNHGGKENLVQPAGPQYTADSLHVKTVVELREILKKNGLPVSGKKQDLVDRILGISS